MDCRPIKLSGEKDSLICWIRKEEPLVLVLLASGLGLLEVAFDLIAEQKANGTLVISFSFFLKYFKID